MSLRELQTRAIALEQDNRLEEARDAYEAALDVHPSSQACAEGRARIALRLKEEAAVSHCARALAFHDEHPERQLRMIETAGVELGSAAEPLFQSFLERHPKNATAHELLSEILAEAGPGDRFLENYRNALDSHPDSKPLLLSYWRTLSRAGRLLDALESMGAKRSILGDDRDFLLLEADIANHAGVPERAARALERLDDRPDADLARGHHLLQTGHAEEAASRLEAVIHADPNKQSAWSLLELAWRIVGDKRHSWLVGQPALYSCCQLELTGNQLDEIAATLRKLHRSRSQPLGQSVRGGTQTAGQLFMRSDPEILLLMNALTTAVRQYVQALPSADPRHPVLRHRNNFLTFGPSWSVRLTDGGYHAPHFHPGGVLSSACYISLPDHFGDEERAGWLELGRPPAELGLDLAPLEAFEAKPGRLVLFPSFLFHGTRHFTGGERLSVAFDVIALD